VGGPGHVEPELLEMRMMTVFRERASLTSIDGFGISWSRTRPAGQTSELDTGEFPKGGLKRVMIPNGAANGKRPSRWTCSAHPPLLVADGTLSASAKQL
jgi:hypothetical protein